MASFLNSMRLSALANGVRAAVWLRSGSFVSHPDEVIQIPSRDDGRSIKAHIYRSTKHKTQPGPVLLNACGSGFVCRLHGLDDEFARRVADETPYTVVDVAYRVAPEDPWPAAPNDIEDAVKWIQSKPSEFDASNLALSGFSAGGSLVLGAAQQFPARTFTSVTTFYPVADISIEPEAKTAPVAGGRPIPNGIAGVFNACYAPSPIDRKDPLVSPAHAAPARFPARMFFATCGYDNLCNEAEQLAHKIEQSPGHHVVVKRLSNFNHGFDKRTKPGSDEAKAKDELYALVIGFLTE